MTLEPFETAEAHGHPTCRQTSVFVENRVGQLLRLTQLFDRTDVRILAVSVVNSVDCAICRMLLDDPDEAAMILTNNGFKISEAELLVVSLPPGRRALLHIWTALLGAEVSVFYTYPLLIHPFGTSALAVLPDDLDAAIQVLRARQFRILDQEALRATRDR